MPLLRRRKPSGYLRTSPGSHLAPPVTHHLVRFDSISLAWFGTSQLDNIRFGSTTFGSVREHSVRFDIVRFGWIPFGLTSLGSIPCGSSTWFFIVRFGIVPYDTIPSASTQFGWIEYSVGHHSVRHSRFEILRFDAFGSESFTSMYAHRQAKLDISGFPTLSRRRYCSSRAGPTSFPSSTSFLRRWAICSDLLNRNCFVVLLSATCKSTPCRPGNDKPNPTQTKQQP